jgi:hypothetical protein
MRFTLDSLSADGQQSVFGVLENDITSEDTTGAAFQVLSTSAGVAGANRRPWWFTAPTGYLSLTVDSIGGYSNNSRERHLYSHIMNDTAGGTSTVHQDGTQVDTRSITLDANATFQQGKVLQTSSNATGALYMSEVIYYPSDQSDKRRAIEENIANHYDITLGAFSRDGTVSTWYDQSGSTPSNDAVQADATKQPKIVDGGSLLKDPNNNPEIDFSGPQELEKSSPSGFSGKEQSYFVKFTPTSIVGYVVELEGGIGAARSLSVEPFLRFNVTTQDYSSTILSGDSLLSLVCPNTPTTIDDYDLYYQGSLLTPDSLSAGVLAGVTSGAINIGSGNYVGRISEAIAYNSDQSDNRTAIEANIGETYGITDIPAANDTVNGYVQTWYDQSGNGNDAAQSAAANQPKIVGEVTSGQPHAFLGALVFDGSGSFMVASGFAFSPSGDMLISSVQKLSTGQMYDARDGGADGIFVQQGGSDLRFRYNGDGSVDASGNNDLSLATFEINGTTMTVYKNGSSAGTDTVVAGLSTTTDFHIGRNSFNVSNYADGKIYEIVAYDSDQSSNRPAIEANILNQYDI